MLIYTLQFNWKPTPLHSNFVGNYVITVITKLIEPPILVQTNIFFTKMCLAMGKFVNYCCNSGYLINF